MLSVLASSTAFASRPLLGHQLEEDQGLKLWITSAWSKYKRDFVLADGRVVDNGNKGISHSESQGYAMVIAVALDDEETFLKVYDFTREKLQVRPEDKLLAWKYDPNLAIPVSDLNNATDGDLLVAWALLEGYKRWGKEIYASAAKAIITSIRSEVVLELPGIGPVLNPGAVGFGSQEDFNLGKPVTLNLSYWVYPALEEIASFDEAGPWNDIALSGDRLLSLAQFPPHFLPPDWLDVGAGLSIRPSQNFPPVFGYNAVRIPLYLAFSDTTYRQKLAADYAGLVGLNNQGGPFQVDLTSGDVGERMGGAGFEAIAGVVQCLDSGTPLPHELMRYNADFYYPGTLQILSFLLVAERYPKCISLE